MGGCGTSLLPIPARARFLSLAMAATVAAFFLGAGAGPSLPHPAEPGSISAAPSFLPAVPRFSASPPAPAPDAMPVLPTPGGTGASVAAPAESMPVIPSNPSPPDPDQFGPTSALAPFGSSAAAVVPSGAARASGEVVAGALVLLQLLRWCWC
uniref:Classical arabinogalactan protein 26 n=1 Tax=Anthurium amnicola TaxID=1678845 RepID=A0A1D1ZEP7_9ARAE